MSKPRPRAILFDLDDTIVEYDGSAARVWRLVVAEFTGSLAGLDVERFMAALNEYREWYWGDPERHRRGRLDLPLARREVVRGTFDLLGVAAPAMADEIADAYSVQLDVSPSEAWMVGDNLEWDVATPQRLGLFSIWVDSAGAGLPDTANVNPDGTIRTLSALTDFLN